MRTVVLVSLLCAGFAAGSLPAAARAQMCPADVTGDGKVSAADVVAVVDSVGSGTCWSLEQSVELLTRLGDALALSVGLLELEELYFPFYVFDSLDIEDGSAFLLGQDEDGFGVVVGVFQDGSLPLAVLAGGEEVCDFTVLGYVFPEDTVAGGVNYGIDNINDCDGDFLDGPNPASGEVLFAEEGAGTVKARARGSRARPGARRRAAARSSRQAVPDAHRASLGLLRKALVARAARR